MNDENEKSDELKKAVAEAAEHYREVSDLLQQTAEAFTIWFWFDQTFHAAYEHYATILSNERFLQILAFSCRRTAIVSFAIATDDSELGKKGYGVWNLINLMEQRKLMDAGPARKKLNDIEKTIKKIRILRNNVDGHYSRDREWQKSKHYGQLTYDEVWKAIVVLMSALCDCGLALAQRREKLEDFDTSPIDFIKLQQSTRGYCEKMMAALKNQLESQAIPASSIPNIPTGKAIVGDVNANQEPPAF